MGSGIQRAKNYWVCGLKIDQSQEYLPLYGGGDKTKKSSRTKTVTNLAIAQMKGAIYLPTTVKQCIIFKAFLF